MYIIISIVSGVFILTGIIFFIRMCRNRAKKDKNNESLLQIELQNINTIDNEEVLAAPEERIGDDFVKIIFNFNQERIEILKPLKASLKDLIISYQKKKQFKNTNMIVFIFDGDKISYDEAINDDRKLSEIMSNDLKEKEILVYDWTSFVSQSSQI